MVRRLDIQGTGRHNGLEKEAVMTERIGQGEEAPADTAARRAAWAARDRDLANTPLETEDVERLLRGLVTQAQIDNAKRDRGKPMP